MDSEGQEFRQGTAEMACVCSTMLRTQLERLKWLRVAWCLGAGVIRKYLHSYDGNLGWDGLKAWSAGPVTGSTCTGFLCSLSFLTACCLQDRWISYMVAKDSKSKCPGDKAGASLPFITWP